jgi:hypothetical protein
LLNTVATNEKDMQSAVRIPVHGSEIIVVGYQARYQILIAHKTEELVRARMAQVAIDQKHFAVGAAKDQSSLRPLETWTR